LAAFPDEEINKKRKEFEEQRRMANIQFKEKYGTPKK
jgi:hypothetical protein